MADRMHTSPVVLPDPTDNMGTAVGISLLLRILAEIYVFMHFRFMAAIFDSTLYVLPINKLQHDPDKG